MITLSNSDARRLFLDKHALGEAPTGAGKGADLLDLISRLGFVQVDSVRTVERAHHMILFSRRPAYRPKNLDALLEKDRSLFEHWTHDASVIPTEFYPYWHLRFARNDALLRKRWSVWRRGGFEEKIQGVLDQIAAQGGCGSGDVGDGEARGSGGWWDWHPSKTALEFLWQTGQLAVSRREQFRKIFDLTNRVIPETHLQNLPTENDSVDWLCNAALDRLGFATNGELAAFWATISAAEARKWCDKALDKGEINQIEVTQNDGSLRKHFARPDILTQLDRAPQPPNRLRILSPFDPALRDRKRAERVFGFHYRIEIFTPAAKRQYGYYVFPLLEQDKLVGRIDASADRSLDALKVTALWPERSISWGRGRQQRLEAELHRMAKFAGTSNVVFADNWLRDPK
ncbi:crosslink repair DNA glycosylase YcaQ family protein [uncultured Pelagimonas sp.]|uniref:winged helix-turn-helix domain-containing protein n=1 Tax=uncultured Pelagimonas sp. TaxID=1618102 RepID=UPI002634711D|nr:crosslink repair DNA glycosylase YcaQ family protein [uncultured Pelagimonas sp.]